MLALQALAVFPKITQGAPYFPRDKWAKSLAGADELRAARNGTFPSIEEQASRRPFELKKAGGTPALLYSCVRASAGWLGESGKSMSCDLCHRSPGNLTSPTGGPDSHVSTL